MTVMSQQARAVSGNHPIAETVTFCAPAPLAGAVVAGAVVAGAVVAGAVVAARPERNRHRYAWMYEDEDIWGTDIVDCVPPSTYGYDWHAPRM
jgi:hypothetical protein